MRVVATHKRRSRIAERLRHGAGVAVAALVVGCGGGGSSAPAVANSSGGLAVVVVPADTTTVGANVNFTNGPWNFYGGMWSRFFDTRLTETSDPLQAGGATNNYYVKATLSPSAFPDNWAQTWVTPSNYSYTRPGAPGVYGYLAASYCNYDNGSINPAGCVQRQVDSIAVLVSDFSFAVAPGGGGTLGDFNVLHEFYLTSAPGDLTTKQLEVGVFLHASDNAVQFQAGGVALGSFTDRWGHTWSGARNGTFVTFVPLGGGDLLTARSTGAKHSVFSRVPVWFRARGGSTALQSASSRRETAARCRSRIGGSRIREGAHL